MHFSSDFRKVELVLSEIILGGHKIVKGRAEGEAIVTRDSISFMGGVDPRTGTITESGSELEGKTISGKIFVFPGGKGSTGGSYMLYDMAKRGTGPKGIVNIRTDSIVAIGAVMGSIPTVDQLERNPLEVIRTGDYVVVDGDSATVRIRKS
jgi:hypothetical protein